MFSVNMVKGKVFAVYEISIVCSDLEILPFISLYIILLSKLGQDIESFNPYSDEWTCPS